MATLFYNRRALDLVNIIKSNYTQFKIKELSMGDSFQFVDNSNIVYHNDDALVKIAELYGNAIGIELPEITYKPSETSITDNIVIMTTLYNAEKYIKRCIDSMKIQKENFICYITDDISTDSSREVVKKEIEGDSRFVLIENKTKMYQPGNYYQISKLDLPDESIVVTLDGDDWFHDENVLTRVKAYYKNPKILIHFGQFIEYNGGLTHIGFTSKPDNLRTIRSNRWSTSHLRTFKLGLFRQIKEEDLRAPNGNFWECTGDMAIIFPMVEMCADSRIGFTNDINMVYNVENPINDSKANTRKQQQYEQMLRKKRSYRMIYK